MNLELLFDPKKTSQLFGHDKSFNLLKSLIDTNKLPKVMLLSGKKGSGKSTLVNHLMFYIFDRKNYETKNKKVLDINNFHLQFRENIFQNILYISGASFDKVKIDDIRKLKSQILQKPLNDKKRYIIFDDIELFNINSLNALLKVIEEPSVKNNFILINNQVKPLIDTIKSRCSEIKISVNAKERIEIIRKLFEFFKQKRSFKSEILDATPGSYIKFNYLFDKNDIDLNNSYIENIKILVTMYKKEKKQDYIDLLAFYTDYYLKSLRLKKIYKDDVIYKNRSYILKSINDFYLYNLNQITLINNLKNNILNE